MHLEPKFARVVVRRDKVQKGRILIPETAEKRNAPNLGVVVAVGPTADQTIKPGMRVLFGRHAGDWMKVDGIDEELYILQDEDVLAEIVA